MITKTAINLATLGNVFKRVVKPRSITAPKGSQLEMISNIAGPLSTPSYAFDRLRKFREGGLSKKTLLAPGGLINKSNIEETINMSEQMVPKNLRDKIIKGDVPDHLWGALSQSDPVSQEAKNISNKIFGVHELDELKLQRKAKAALRRGQDTMIPTGHVHPEVLLREHNILSTLEAKPHLKDETRNVFRALRENNQDLRPLDEALKPFGGYGTGTRLNRSARKHISKKINTMWDDQVRDMLGSEA